MNLRVVLLRERSRFSFSSHVLAYCVDHALCSVDLGPRGAIDKIRSTVRALVSNNFHRGKPAMHGIAKRHDHRIMDLWLVGLPLAQQPHFDVPGTDEGDVTIEMRVVL